MPSLALNEADLMNFKLIDVPGIRDLEFMLTDLLSSSSKNVLFLIDCTKPSALENAEYLLL